MTESIDVIRQVETVLNDSRDPPTPEQKKILKTILHRVVSGTAESEFR